MPTHTEAEEIGKGHAFVVSDIVNYVPNAVTSHNILRKATGTVSVVSVDAGKELIERTSPFDTFIMVIEGRAEVKIEAKSFPLDAGEAIIIPAHSRNSIVGTERFKIVSTVIKSGYEEVIM
jgi:quercetin dioxygenase-like cupin family protein